MGADVEPGIERYRAADYRMAGVACRTQALLHHLHHAVHGEFAVVRHGADAWLSAAGAGDPGHWRRRVAAHGAGDPCGYVSAEEARAGVFSVWRNGRGGA